MGEKNPEVGGEIGNEGIGKRQGYEERTCIETDSLGHHCHKRKQERNKKRVRKFEISFPSSAVLVT